MNPSAHNVHWEDAGHEPDTVAPAVGDSNLFSPPTSLALSHDFIYLY